jgi:hypothetical protein
MQLQGWCKGACLVICLLWVNVCAAFENQLGNRVGADSQDKPINLAESNIAPDEVLQFFTTDAFQSDIDADGNYTWQIPVHAWVYEPANSQVRMKVVKESMALVYDLQVSSESVATFEQRVNHFLVDNERGKWFTVQLEQAENANSTSLFRVGNTEANGHVTANILVEQLVQELVLKPTIKSVFYCSTVNAKKVCGRARLISQQGLSVISDIDDTVKISDVRSKKALIENTFFNPFVAVPDIAEVYSGWSEQGASFHYVSSSPWYLYTELTSFLKRAGFPDFSLSLKSFRFRDESLLELFKDGEATKPNQIRQILEKFPQRQFVLIGDSGEQDPEVYSAIKQQFSEQIKGIYIRDLGPEDANQVRVKGLIDSMDGFPIVLFKDASELPVSLTPTH